MRVVYSFCQSLIRVFAKLFYDAEIINPYPKNQWKRYIVAANHMALSDPPLIGSFIPIELNFIAKAELFNNPFIGTVLRFFNAIPIRRGTVDRKAITIALEKLNKDQTILIFPEGSRTSTTARPGIAKLAVETKTDILPVYIENSNHFLDCLLRRKKLRIIFGKPIAIENYLQSEVTKDTYRKLASDVLEKIYQIGKEYKLDEY